MTIRVKLAGRNGGEEKTIYTFYAYSESSPLPGVGDHIMIPREKQEYLVVKRIFYFQGDVDFIVVRPEEEKHDDVK